jgi:hypothetical protein
VSPVRYELGFYITEDDILHSHRRENLKSDIADNIHWPFALGSQTLKFQTMSVRSYTA